MNHSNKRSKITTEEGEERPDGPSNIPSQSVSSDTHVHPSDPQKFLQAFRLVSKSLPPRPIYPAPKPPKVTP